MSDRTRGLDPTIYAQALAAAQSLQAILAERLIGVSHSGWSCNCGACTAGDSKVIGVSFPPQRYPDQIGMHSSWYADLEDVHGKKWSTGISTFIGREEIYPLFRNVFAGITVELDRPFTDLYTDNPATPFQTAKAGPNFVGSGRFVQSENLRPAYVRPRGDLRNSVWVNCALHAETDLPDYEEGLLLSACTDALETGVENGRGRWGQFRPQSAEQQHTFYVVLMGNPGVLLPVARVHAIDWVRGVVVFELHETVEEVPVEQLPGQLRPSRY